ncbi:hypothetical protein HDU86_000889 [Geranomyces michiganensis]|nr:hypothetical protein HDU86_000889 [Geranomyces michiganensis]
MPSTPFQFGQPSPALARHWCLARQLSPPSWTGTRVEWTGERFELFVRGGLWVRANLPIPASQKRKAGPNSDEVTPPPKRYQVGGADDDVLECAPPILELDDGEKFRDATGQAFGIETRGERAVGKVFFLAADVSLLIDGDHSSVQKKCQNPNSSFKQGRNEDYLKFRRSPTSGQKDLYLTYMGALRVFATSRNANARPFFEWAVRVVQVAHIGVDEDRVILAANLARVDIRVAEQVFKGCNPAPSGVYLISLGCLKDLRDSLTIENTDVMTLL